MPAPMVMATTLIRNSINRNRFGRGLAGSAHRLNGEAIASQAKVLLAAPIGGARRELIALARTSHKNLIDAAAARSCSTDHYGLLFSDDCLPRRPLDIDFRSVAIPGTEHRISVQRAAQVRGRSIKSLYPGVR